MNWYSIFYWITIADNVKLVTGILAVVLGAYFVIASAIAVGLGDESFTEWASSSRKAYYLLSTFFMLNLFIWVFIPSKKDALIIVAGGAVGSFITSDSSAKQIPAELTALLRDKIRSEIKDLKLYNTDTLASKSKEELIELLKNK